MRRWLIGSLVSICILIVVFIGLKPNTNSDLIESTTPPISSVSPTSTLTTNEEWFLGLSNSNEIGISTMEDGMQRMYKPTDRMFYNNANVLLEFFYRHDPLLSQEEIKKLKNDIVVKTKVDQKPIPFTVIAFEETRSQGISIQLNHVPQADLIVQFHSLDGLSSKEFSFEYTRPFTYQINSPDDKEADYYAMNSGTYYRVAPNRTYTFQVHFSLDVNREDAINALYNQFQQLDWSTVWESNQDLTITLRTHPQDMYKKFLINFQGVKNTDGYVVMNGNGSLHGVITEMMKYETIDMQSGKVGILFQKLPRYQTLDVSSDGKYYLAKELQDDFQGEFSIPNVTLLGAHGDVIKHFGQARYPHWLADGQSFVYASGDSILRYIPATQQTTVIWTSPYKDDRTIFYNIDGMELDLETGRFVVSLFHHLGTAMDIGNVDLYVFNDVNDKLPRKVEQVSKRGNSSFAFQFNGKHIFYANSFVVADGSHWDYKLQKLDWKDLIITDLKEFTITNGLRFLQDGEVIYQKGDSNNPEWFRYDFENDQSNKLFDTEHSIDVAWWVGKDNYVMHDFTGTYLFSIRKPRFEKSVVLPKQAEIVGSSEQTIIYLQNPDPNGSM